VIKIALPCSHNPIPSAEEKEARRSPRLRRGAPPAASHSGSSPFARVPNWHPSANLGLVVHGARLVRDRIAGALHWKSLLETPSQRFDLVVGVNVRAAFLACRAVLPTMIARGWGHIINMSPPIDLAMVPGRVAYGISKLGMTLLTHGLAAEVRSHNIAVNSLWPVTLIESQASINWNLGTPADWRKPDILVDCVLRLVQKEAAEITGQALLDEDFLRGEGVTDFSHYACVPGSTPRRLSWS
jgi:citronellol/citronellal dehydrogenase